MGAAGVSFPLTPGLDAVWGSTPSLDHMRKLLDTIAYDRGLVTDELAHLRYEASIQAEFSGSIFGHVSSTASALGRIHATRFAQLVANFLAEAGYAKTLSISLVCYRIYSMV